MPDKRIKNVFTTPTPETPHYSEHPDEEPSRVTDLSGMFRKTEKMERLLLRMAPPISRIPEVESKVDNSIERVTRVEEKIEAQKDKISYLDQKVLRESRPHDCYQVDVISELKNDQKEASQKIDTDIQRGVKHSTIIKTITDDIQSTTLAIDDMRKAPRRMFYSFIVAIITSVVGAVWFLADLSKDVEIERAQRTQQISKIEDQMKGVVEVIKKVDTAPVARQVERLERTVRSNETGKEYNDLCKGMAKREKVSMSRLIKRRNKRVPESCVIP